VLLDDVAPCASREIAVIDGAKKYSPPLTRTTWVGTGNGWTPLGWC